jgi:hypothetical protein
MLIQLRLQQGQVLPQQVTVNEVNVQELGDTEEPRELPKWKQQKTNA